MFPENAPSANPVFARTYSRRINGKRETWQEVCDRTIKGLAEVGKFTPDEIALVTQMQEQIKTLPSGRWLWVGGTDWIKKPENFPGAYNCTSTNVIDWQAFGLMMDLAMQGCGTGAVLEQRHISKLPPIRNRLNLKVVGEIGATPKPLREDETSVQMLGDRAHIQVGDSRKGWVTSYQVLLPLASDQALSQELFVTVDISHVRPKGEALKGFGGVANPVKLAEMYERVAAILNRAVGRQLTSVECCLLIDEAAACVVAGNVRRSAGIRQGDRDDEAFAVAKDNLWQQDEKGNWRIDPERDALRMANHTRVFHRKPTEQECIDSVRKQYYSGEGAIQYAPEAIARSNADILHNQALKAEFIEAYERSPEEAIEFLQSRADHEFSTYEAEHRLYRFGLNPCAEILGSDLFCNLSEIHLNRLDPFNFEEQEKAFTAGALSVAALLHHEFTEERYRKSRELDPIVGVSFTGLFDFFVHAFGIDWLRWWEAGRPDGWGKECVWVPLRESFSQSSADVIDQSTYFRLREQEYLSYWREIVHRTVWEYCDRHNLKRPNRCTTVQPAGTKSLLTGASPGWHPPKAIHFIRRITFGREDAVANACIDYGYPVVPSQSCKDENGNLLDDPFDPRVTEWLVEIPTKVSWADLPGAEDIAIEKFSALAQFDFYMQVQRHYTAHNTSATIELREDEIEPLAKRIHQAIANDEGYSSAALLARLDAPYPRLPFEAISAGTYQKLQALVEQRRKNDDFMALVNRDSQAWGQEGPAGCDSDKCLISK